METYRVTYSTKPGQADQHSVTVKVMAADVPSAIATADATHKLASPRFNPELYFISAVVPSES